MHGMTAFCTSSWQRLNTELREMTTNMKNTLLLFSHKMQITAVPLSDTTMLQYWEVTEMLS